MAEHEGQADEAFLLAVYLLTSARGCLDEPKIYGVSRLLEALARLIDLLRITRELRPDAFLQSMKARIDDLKLLILSDPQKLAKELDETIRNFTAELEKRTLQTV